MQKIGITERGDPVWDDSWMSWVVGGNPAILISKNPLVLAGMLKEISSPNVIVHATITGYGGSILEPNVPKPPISLNGYEELINLLGEDRVVLRIDPIILTDKGIDVAYLIKERATGIASTRVRISFLDMYSHVRKRFIDANIPVPIEHALFHSNSSRRRFVWQQLGRPEVCGEPDLEVTGCISSIDCDILGVNQIKKCVGQRETCACLGNKFELLSRKNRCEHFCIYCYWKD